MAQGWLQLAVFVAVVIALTRPLGAYMARVFRHERVFLTPILAPAERVTYRILRVDPNDEPGLEGLRPQPDRVLALLLGRALPDPAHAGHPAVQPGRLRLRPVGRELQHRLVVRQQHQLAVLRRRDDAQLLRPDGGADGRRTSSPPRSGICALVAMIRGIIARSGNGPRQLLAGPRPEPLLRPAAAVDRRRPDPRLAGRAADARRRGHRDDARGRQPDARPRPGRLAGRDQAARHQRRRVLQRQLGDAVRERHRRSRTSSRCCRSS